MEGVKEAHRREVDRLMGEMRRETEESEREGEEARRKFIEEVRRREREHKAEVEGIRLEHDQCVEGERRVSDESLHQQKARIKAKSITARDTKLKLAIEDLSAKKLLSSKALESQMHPQLSQAKSELRLLTADLQARPTPLPATITRPILQDSSVNTEVIDENKEAETEKVLADIAAEVNTQCEELEIRAGEMVNAVETRLKGLEERYKDVVAECKAYEEAIAEIAVISAESQ